MNPSGSATNDQPPVAELERRLAALNRLLDVTRALAAEVDPLKVLERIAAEACRALECERASVYQYDPLEEELVSRVTTGLEIGEIRSRLDHGISGCAARTRQIVNVPDPPADPRWSPRVDRATGYQTRSILAAPLVSTHDDALLGVLELLNNHGGPFDTFDEELVVAFAQHAAVALDRARLVEELRKRQVVEAALHVARGIQRGFMPERLPSVPDYELASWWFPHQEVGGDYCDVLPLCDGRTALVVADVSGHGIGPSLIMASARAALRALALEHSTAEDLLSLLAQALGSDLDAGHFITMVLATLDATTHSIEYANAGHAPAVYFSRADSRFAPLVATGLPLGVEHRPTYPQGPALSMQVGDLVVLCTDGIVEAMDTEDEQFGQHRLEEIIRVHADAPLADLVREIGTQVEQHYVGESPPDDLTILAARRQQ